MHCVGFYAHFTIALPPAWPIVDTHPDPVSTTDLRLVKPWPALLEFMESKTKGLGTMENDDHGHVPYLLLLAYYLEEWKKTHDGKVPSAYKEKQEFRDLVRKGMRTNTPEGSEENYEEAISAVLKSLNEPTASSAVREIWDADECQNLTNQVRMISNLFVQTSLLTTVLSPTTSGSSPPPSPNSTRRTECSHFPAQYLT
jgi:amyloid beta precursor protein binding protein 1